MKVHRTTGISAVDEISAGRFTHRLARGAALPNLGDLKLYAPLVWAWIHAKGDAKIITLFGFYAIRWNGPIVHIIAEQILGADPGP